MFAPQYQEKRGSEHQKNGNQQADVWQRHQNILSLHMLPGFPPRFGIGSFLQILINIKGLPLMDGFTCTRMYKKEHSMFINVVV